MEEIIQTFGPTFWLVAKAAILLFLILYMIFATVVVRQVKLMTETLEVGFEKPIRTLALGHLIFSVLVFILSIFIL